MTNKPTIDELIKFLEGQQANWQKHNPGIDGYYQCIRGILEQYKLRTSTESEMTLTVWGYTIPELGDIVGEYDRRRKAGK